MNPTFEYPGVKVWDNLIDDLFLHNIDDETNNLEFKYSITGGPSIKFPQDKDRNYKFWGRILFRRESIDSIYNVIPTPLYELYLHLINNIIKENFLLEKCHINGQTYKQDGGIHIDVEPNQHHPYSLMIFLNHLWKPDWGGEFEIYDTLSPNAQKLYTIDYTPGRVILFKGDIPHRGLGPSVPNILRKSLVFKLEKL